MKKIWVGVMILLLSGCIIAQTMNHLRTYKVGISGFPILIIPIIPGFSGIVIMPHLQVLIRINDSLALNIKGGYPNVLTTGFRCYSKRNALKGFYLGAHLMVFNNNVSKNDYKFGAGFDIGNTFIFRKFIWKNFLLDIGFRCTYKESPHETLYPSMNFFDSISGLELAFPISIGLAF